MKKYAWIIDVDHIENNETHVTGPSNADSQLLNELINSPARTVVEGTGKNIKKFKMYDDDNELYYSGRIIGDYDCLEPLDDFGTPNAGCTEIQVLEDGKWITV